ncbi:MAG: hypothetical protein GX591_05095 [Planctomycetes bacterium]|nr:hypothetical protein [Planctomycetota bacterium]
MNTPILQDARGIRRLFRNVGVRSDRETSVHRRHFPVKGETVPAEQDGQ